MAQSSLAQQLQNLRIQQKDEIALPERTKISLIFEIKDAASIDDQTLYYICQGGLKEIQRELPELYQSLQPFQNDLLSEKSLEFYRGTQTKDTVKHIDSQLNLLIKLLSPYFLFNSTHKVLEYLIRIYEINAYQKQNLVNAFLPYFETSFFLRMIQLLNLKDDDIMFFLHQFAFEGKQIDKKTLIKGLSRSNGLFFTKYSEYCFDLAETFNDTGIVVQNNLHWKFFGSMLSEILKTHYTDQTLLFSILPLISKGLKSNLTELKISSLIGISQIVCRQSLTLEYSQAFFDQILKSLKEGVNSDEIVEKIIVVLNLISQYQNFDLSYLFMKMFDCTLNQDAVDINTTMNAVKQSLNIKSYLLITESVITQSISNQTLKDKTQSILTALKENNANFYDQTLSFILQRCRNSNERENVIKVLQGNSTHLVQVFGDKEYSLLSAIASESKITQSKAIQQLMNEQFISKLSTNEKELIRISLSSLITNQSLDEHQLGQTLQAYFALSKVLDSNDFEFQSLASFMDNGYQLRYSDNVTQLILNHLAQFKLNNSDLEVLQLKIAICTGQMNHSLPKLLQEQSKTPSKQSLKTNDLSQILTKDFVIGSLWLQQLFKLQKNWIKEENLIKLLQVFIKSQVEKGSKINEFYYSLLENVKQQTNNEELLQVIMENVTFNNNNNQHDYKLASIIIGANLNAKQKNHQFDLSGCALTIFNKYGNKQVGKVCEFYLQIALQSKNELKIVFALSSLLQHSKNNQLNSEVIIGTIMILLNQSSKKVREYAFMLAKQHSEMKEGQNEINLFINTPKPKSAKKNTDKHGFTPLKLKPAQKLLKDLLKSKDEIISDQNQLQIALNSAPHNQILDSVMRTLLDLPSIKIRLQLIKVFGLMNYYSLIFSMTLQEQLSKEYYQLKKLEQIGANEINYISQIGQFISRVCLTQGQSEANEEFLSSLVFPFLKFVFTIYEEKKLSTFGVEQTIQLMFEKNLLKADVIKGLQAANTTEIIRFYLQSQYNLQSSLIRQSIRQLFIESSQESIIDKEVIPIITDKIIDFKKDRKHNLFQLEILLETILQVKIQEEANIIPLIIEILQTLIQLNTDGQYNFIIEISIQICLKIFEVKNKQRLKILNIQGSIVEIVTKGLDILTSKITTLVSLKDQLDDPFKQFVMEIDEGKEKKDKKDQKDYEIYDQVLISLQTNQSLFNLLLSFETSIQQSFESSKNQLKKVTDYIKESMNNESFKSVNGNYAIQRLFKYYHNITTKLLSTTEQKSVDNKPVISDYIEVLLSISDFGQSDDEIQNYINSFKRSVVNQSLIVMLLLCFAKNHISVKDNLNIDSFEISLIRDLMLKSESILSIIQDLLFQTTLLTFSDKSDQFILKKMKALQEQQIIQDHKESSFFIYQNHIKEHRESRRLKYLTVYLLNAWINKDNEIKMKIAYETQASQQGQKKVNNNLYNIYLTSQVFSESVKNSLQNKDFTDKKAKKSLKRLSSRIQEFQQNLINLLSYELQVEIVKKVLNNEDKSTIPLKTVTIQLLINKTPQFAQSLSKIQETELIGIFSPLIKKAISMLSEIQEKLEKDSELQSLAISLFALLQRCISNEIEKGLKKKLCSIIYQYFTTAGTYSLMLHSQIILTGLTLFEVYQVQILEDLPLFFDFLVQTYSRATKSSIHGDFFNQSFVSTLLKATLSVITFFSKFLNSEQYEQVIKNVLPIDNAFEKEIKAILSVLSSESIKNVGLKTIFQALINSYDDVIIQKIVINNEISENPEAIIIRFFNDIMKPVIQRMKKDFCSENYIKIFKFFRSAFGLTYQFFKNRGEEISKRDEVLTSIGQAYEQFIIKLNEEQLRPLVVKHQKWAFKKKTSDDNPFGFNVHYGISFFTTVNIIIEGLKEFFVPLMPLYFEKVVDTLHVFAQERDEDEDEENTLGKKRPKNKVIALQFDHNTQALLNLLVQNLMINFKYDNNSFIQNDSFEKISEPLAKLVTLTQLKDNYKEFIENNLKMTIFEVVERINNDDMWKKINFDILINARNPNPEIRLSTFNIIEYLFQRIGERYLILLNDTLPFLSEGLEDENPDVEQTVKSIISRIEQMTGDSIHEYLK